jgi:AcrR family transcriptional regulator
VPPEQARQRLVEAAIGLLHTTDPLHVTVREIATAAGLNLVHITRYFGSRAELLFAVSEELHQRLVARARSAVVDDPSRVLGFEEVRMRLGVLMALRSEGFDMRRFQPSEHEIFTELAAFFARTREVDMTVAEIHAIKILLLVQSLHLMGDAHGLSNEQVTKVVELVADEMEHAKESAVRLGWA